MGDYAYYSTRPAKVGDGYIECFTQVITKTLSIEAVTANGQIVRQIKLFFDGNGVDSYLVNSATVTQGLLSIPVRVNNALSFYIPALGRWSDYLSTTGFTLPGNVDFTITVSLKVPVRVPIIGGSGTLDPTPTGPAEPAPLTSVYTDPGTITDYFLGYGTQVSPLIWWNYALDNPLSIPEANMPINDNGCVALWDGEGAFKIRSYRFFTLEDDVEFTITLDLDHTTAETAGYSTDYYFYFLDIEVRYENNFWDDHDYFEVNSYNPEYLALRDAILAANNTVTIKFSYSATTHILTITCNGDVSDATTIECYHDVQTTELSPIIIEADCSDLLPTYFESINKANTDPVNDDEYYINEYLNSFDTPITYNDWEAYIIELSTYLGMSLDPYSIALANDKLAMTQYLPQITIGGWTYGQFDIPNIINKITSIVTTKGTTNLHPYFNGINDRNGGVTTYSKIDIKINNNSLINNGDIITFYGPMTGPITFNFVSILSGNPNEILIGVNADTTISNMAISFNNTFGALFSGSPISDHIIVTIWTADMIVVTTTCSGITLGEVIKTLNYSELPNYTPTFLGTSFSSNQGILGDVYHLSTIPRFTGESTCSMADFNMGAGRIPLFYNVADSFVSPCTDASSDADKIALMLYGNNWMEWFAGLVALPGDDDDVALVIAQWVARNITYSTDLLIYGVAEYWADPRRVLKAGVGDCEDFSFLIASLLLNNGVDPSKVRVYIGTWNGVGHAWVCYRRASDDEWVVLDGTKG